MERWSVLPLDTRYEVSTFGQIRRIDTQRVRKCSVTPIGYRTLVLMYPAPDRPPRKQVAKTYYVHEAVLLTFVGPRPEGMQVSHIDGDKLNNRLDNLLYESRKDNINRHPQERCKRLRVLTKADISYIKTAPLSCKSLGKQFGLQPSMVSKLRRGVCKFEGI